MVTLTYIHVSKMLYKHHITSYKLSYINKQLAMYKATIGFYVHVYIFYKFLFTSASGSRTSQHPVPEAIGTYWVLAIFYFK